MKKVCLVGFQGELMCFAHVLLNALDYFQKGYDVKIVIEGSATALIKELVKKENPFHELYCNVKKSNLIDCVCMACSAKMGVLEDIKKEELPLNNEMSGHPPLSHYSQSNYQIITF